METTEDDLQVVERLAALILRARAAGHTPDPAVRRVYDHGLHSYVVECRACRVRLGIWHAAAPDSLLDRSATPCAALRTRAAAPRLATGRPMEAAS